MAVRVLRLDACECGWVDMHPRQLDKLVSCPKCGKLHCPHCHRPLHRTEYHNLTEFITLTSGVIEN